MSDAEEVMTEDRELPLLALLEWEERWHRWHSVPEQDRAQLVRELARVMVRMADGERTDERGKDCGDAS